MNIRDIFEGRHCPESHNNCKLEQCVFWDTEVGCLKVCEAKYFKYITTEEVING